MGRTHALQLARRGASHSLRSRDDRLHHVHHRTSCTPGRNVAGRRSSPPLAAEEK